MINSAVKQACPSCIQKEVPDFVYHDYLIALLSVKVGGVIVPLKEATIFYRRHGDNETDALKFGSSIFSRLGDVFKYISEQKKRHTFFRELGYGNFLKYLIYKLKLLYLRKQYAS